MTEKNSGRIVIISSIGATTAMPKSSLYSSIKSGVYAYGRSISTELQIKIFQLQLAFLDMLKLGHTREQDLIILKIKYHGGCGLLQSRLS